jgi:hypothetical protein
MDMKQTNSHVSLQVGDLVRVLDGTHDAAMPQSRTGLIVEVTGTSGKSWVYMVQFGTSILRFHGMFLEKVS